VEFTTEREEKYPENMATQWENVRLENNHCSVADTQNHKLRVDSK